LRILVVNNLYPPVVVGGYEVECRDVVDHLSRRHDVTVLTSSRERERCPPQAGVIRALPFLEETVVHSLRAPVDALRGARIARAVLEGARPDLVYVWNGAAIPQVALRILATSGVPLAFRICEHWFGQLYGTDVFTRHLVPGERGLRGAWARGMRLVNRLPELRVDLDVPVPAAICWNARAVRDSASVHRSLRPVLEALIYPANARVDAFDGARREPDDPPRLLFVGRLDRAKGADVAIRALAALRDRHGVRARLAVVGEGPLREELADLAAGLGVAGEVDLLGARRGEALFEEVARAAAWIVPSVWEEPAPLVCTEAALARVPAVLSKVGGIPEMLREEEHALFFAKGDGDGCAAALTRVLGEPEATEARVRRAHARGRELAFGPYLAAMDEFLDAGIAAVRG